MSGYLRLRQICLVARELEPVEAALRDVFSMDPCFHDELFGGKFSIHNVIFAIGGAFLEVVGLHPGSDPKKSPAGRYLERRKGDGGYMVILECNDVERREAYMAGIGVRIVLHPNHDGFNEIQLHPGDTGGTIIAINESAGRDGLVGLYPPAGPGWWLKAQPSPLTREIVAAELQSADPGALAARWSRVLERPIRKRAGGVPEIILDLGSLRFVPATDSRGEGLGGIDMVVTERRRVLAAATARGLAVTGDVVHICGTRIRLVQP